MKTVIALFAAAAANVLFSNIALAQINLAQINLALFVPSDAASDGGYGISTCISRDFAIGLAARWEKNEQICGLEFVYFFSTMNGLNDDRGTHCGVCMAQ